MIDRRVFKKAVQRGRSEQRGDAYPLLPARSPSLSRQALFPGRYVESLSAARTKPGETCASAHEGGRVRLVKRAPRRTRAGG
jgi:hypothetical protein